MGCLKFPPPKKMNWSLVFNLATIPEAVAVVTAVAKRMSQEHALLDF